MDIAAAVCAQSHTEKISVTASMNQEDFNAATKVGDVITITAKITWAFNTSMEIFVESFAKNILVGKKYLISKVYFTSVALYENEKAALVIAVKPGTLSEKEQFNEIWIA